MAQGDFEENVTKKTEFWKEVYWLCPNLNTEICSFVCKSLSILIWAFVWEVGDVMDRS